MNSHFPSREKISQHCYRPEEISKNVLIIFLLEILGKFLNY